MKIAGQAQDENAHVVNFSDAVRGTATLHAEIEIGHLSSSLCHLGNIACRLGRSLRFDPATETCPGDDEANRLLGRAYRSHWGAPRGEKKT